MIREVLMLQFVDCIASGKSKHLAWTYKLLIKTHKISAIKILKLLNQKKFSLVSLVLHDFVDCEASEPDLVVFFCKTLFKLEKNGIWELLGLGLELLFWTICGYSCKDRFQNKYGPNNLFWRGMFIWKIVWML